MRCLKVDGKKMSTSVSVILGLRMKKQWRGTYQRKKNLQEILGILIIPGEKKSINCLKFGTRELKVVAPLINYQPHNTYFKERHKIPDIFNIVDMYLLLPKSKSLAARKQSKQTPKPHLPHVQCVLKIVVAHMSHISRTSNTGRFHTIWP